MDLKKIDRLVGKEIFGVQDLTVEEAVEKFAEKRFRAFTEDGCIVDDYTKLKFDKQEYNRLFSGGYYIPNWKKWLKENSVVITEYPPYSSDIRYAWQVVNEMNKKGFYFNLNQDSDFEFDAIFSDGYYVEDTTISVIFSHKSAPLAICLAALKAVGVEVDES
jgi:Phage ABA sandwich domain